MSKLLGSRLGNAHSFGSKAYVSAYLVLWTIFFLPLRKLYGFEASEPLAALVILGLIFPGISLLAIRFRRIYV